VQTLVVKALEKNADQIKLELSASFEQSQNGYLTQSFSMTRIEYRLEGGALRMNVQRRRLHTWAIVI
jgi:hypothetical protein